MRQKYFLALKKLYSSQYGFVFLVNYLYFIDRELRNSFLAQVFA